ncbi:L-seryl-tRNA(Sec) selenium transferase [Caminibacter mediatlanticus TB-2]|uniref:L-seryl-tRNA(Sec) selenium transferase n=1 Tax=Caminibacter mediatlanticus TB-2 TaxID=391592 RepID=A0ABX5VAC6_9BACT|nr:L-seryl-tRNA(Sec) selenium transferase [Caminibacter mediatlanticus]QCT95213.1 L-seryl-tRNA(Sec) selenium transferase [Caminibacter mediatlanticus TB-2]
MELFRKIPKVDKILSKLNYPKKVAIPIINKHLNKLRENIKNGVIKEIDEDNLIKEIELEIKKAFSPSMLNIINATGVIIHTNLGRSLIDEEIFEKAKQLSTRYSNLEYNLEKSKRGDRYTHASKFLRLLFGCEDALIVNNNAAAVFLILNTFAKDKEVIVSRGELVEIGGSFRIPEVMKASGAKLIEVGTTNKTKIQDYKEAITENTSMLMKVHKSNYTIEGFSEEASLEEIVNLAKDNNLLDYYDLGSAYLPPLPYNLGKNEPSIFDIMKKNPSLVSFSGDKLFGSVQAGIILGKKELIAKLKKNQILRMFRVDKITLSIIEATALEYLKENYEKIPTLKLLYQNEEKLIKKAKKIIELSGKDLEIKKTFTYVGGGTMPNKKIPSIAIVLNGNPTKLEKYFRENLIIGRIENEKFLLDVRTILEDEFEKVAKVIRSLD